MADGARADELLWGGRLQVKEVLGRGGFGTAYVAENLLDGRIVCLKVVECTDDRTLEDALHEPRMHARLEHPNIARYYDAFLEERQDQWGSCIKYLCLVMEVLPAGSLSSLIKKKAVGGALRARAIVRDIAEGLAHMHTRAIPIMHCCLASTNICLDPDGHAKIIDFGGALETADPVTATPGDVGIPAYMSPERSDSAPFWTPDDVWALGLIALELLTETSLTDAMGSGIRSFAKARPRLDEWLARARSVDEPLVALIDRMLAERPEDRPAGPAIVAALDSLGA